MIFKMKKIIILLLFLISLVSFVTATNELNEIDCVVYEVLPTIYDYQGGGVSLKLRSGTVDNMVAFLQWDLSNYSSVDSGVFNFYVSQTNNLLSAIDLEIEFCEDYIQQETCSVANWDNYSTVYQNCVKVYDVDSTLHSALNNYTINITENIQNDSDGKFTLKMRLNPPYDGIQRLLYIDSLEGTNKPFIDMLGVTCTPDWTCFGYDECNATDEAPCDSVVDDNSCGVSYTGDYLEFTPLTCDYCSANVVLHNESVCINNIQTTFYQDLNFGTCCNVTGIEADCEQVTEYVSSNSSCNFRYDEQDLTPSITDMIVKFFIVIGFFIVPVCVIYIGIVVNKVIKGKK